MFFKRCIAEIEPSLALKIFKERVRRIQINARVIFLKIHESLVFICTHVGYIGLYVRIT